MKNIIFQKMLAGTLVVGTLLAMNYVSAMVVDRNELPQGFSSSAQTAFDTIMNRPWQKSFGARLRMNWGLWSINQQAQIVQRMVEQGLISPSQAEEVNWIDLEEGPAVTIGG